MNAGLISHSFSGLLSHALYFRSQSGRGQTIAICILKAYRGLGASAINDVIFLKVVTKIDRIDSGAR